MGKAALFRYEGEGELRAAGPYHVKLADELYVVGELYRLSEASAERSSESHRHYFAAIAEGWKNLPEIFAERLVTPEHLRKYALIKAGYADSHSIACSSKAEAQRIAAFIEPIDEFAVITVDQATVTRWTAKSQSYKAMGKKVFGESKQAVLDVIAALIDVSVADLKRNSGKAA